MPNEGCFYKEWEAINPPQLDDHDISNIHDPKNPNFIFSKITQTTGKQYSEKRIAKISLIIPFL